MDKKIDELKTELEAARAAVRDANTQENRERFKLAWNAHASAVVAAQGGPRRASGFACRAGQRQAAERRAEAAQRQRQRKFR